MLLDKGVSVTRYQNQTRSHRTPFSTLFTRFRGSKFLRVITRNRSRAKAQENQVFGVFQKTAAEAAESLGRNDAVWF